MSVEKAPARPMYLNNKELLIAVKESQDIKKMSPRLAKMLQLLCAKYASKGNFVNYSYNDDMQAYAMMMLVRTWHNFDLTKSNNPFAFFTQCIKNSFIQYLKIEKKQRTVRDLLLVDQGMNPSYKFQEEVSDQHFVEDEQDYYHYKETAAELMQHLSSEETTLFKEIEDITPDDLIESDDDLDEANSLVI